MVMISIGGEARATPSYHSIGSPRYGGCVGAFLHFFDWSPGKCFYSTKRLPANKLGGGMRRSRSFRSDHGSTARTRMMCDEQDVVVEEGSTSRGSGILGGDASARAPSVVARLMGLESLPKSPYHPSRHRRCQSYSGSELPFAFVSMNHSRDEGKPAMLQDLLERDFKAASKKLTLRDRMPGFAKRAQEQYENRFMKKGAAYMDMIPDVHTQSKSKSEKQPFLSRLAPSNSLSPSEIHTPHASPSQVSIDGIGSHVPELSLQAAGWPTAGEEQHSHEVSFRSERSSLLGSESSSRLAASTKSASSKPALANVARKFFQGRRRGTSWNESEDSESNSSHVEADFRGGDPLPPQHRKPAQALKKVVKSLPPPRHRIKPGVHHEASVREFKTSGTRIPVISKAAQNLRTSSTVIAILSSSKDVVDSAGQADQARQPLIPSRSRSTDFQSELSAQDHNSRTSTASPAESTSTTGSQTSNLPISSKTSTGGRPGDKFTRNAQKIKSDTVPSKVVSKAAHGKPPPLDGYRAPKARDGQKMVLSNGAFLGYGKLRKEDKAHIGGAQEMGSSAPRFTDKAAGGVVTSKQLTKVNTLQGIQRVRETMLPNRIDRLKRNEMATPRVPDQQAIVEDDTDRGYRKNGMISKHARARSIDDVFPELPLELNSFSSCPCETDTPTDTPMSGGFSGSPLRGKCDKVVTSPLESCELLTEEVFHVDLQEFFAADQADDASWAEDETVEQRVSSPLSERSCSGPSISSVSVVSDVDDERNGDDWSSCASYNPADCDSPRTFELLDTDDDESDLHEQKSVPMFMKKISEESDTATGTEHDELAAGQPSPVSILNSPFHDEAGTASEYTLHSDEEGNFKSSSSRMRENPDHSPSTKYDDNDKIRQALLDISMFQCLEVFTFDYKELSNSSGPKEEERFVRDILSAANFMNNSPGSSPNWFDQDVAIDPSLFDRLESGDIDNGVEIQKMFQMSGGLWRCDRKLLFDCVNEAFASRNGCSESMGLQTWCCSRRSRGEKLVEEVYKKIVEWRKLAALSIDSLIERDMGSRCGKWTSFGAEVAEVGMDIESMVWEAMVEEVVMDMVATWKRT